MRKKPKIFFAFSNESTFGEAKVSANRAKYIWVSLIRKRRKQRFISEMQPNFGEANGSANRRQYKTKNEFLVLLLRVNRFWIWRDYHFLPMWEGLGKTPFSAYLSPFWAALMCLEQCFRVGGTMLWWRDSIALFLQINWF